MHHSLPRPVRTLAMAVAFAVVGGLAGLIAAKVLWA